MSQTNATGEPRDYYMNVTGGYWPTETLASWTCANCGGTCFSNMVHHCPMIRGNVVSVTGGWRCPNCDTWVTGFHNCPVPVSIPTVWVSPQPERKPHICPVCEGRGNVNVPRPVDSELRSETCPACKGKCVLWG